MYTHYRYLLCSPYDR